MLTILFTIVLIITLTIIGQIFLNQDLDIGILALIIAVALIFLLLGECIVIFHEHINAPSAYAELSNLKESYEAILNSGKYDIINNIIDYNTNLIKAQTNHHNPWLNWFYPSYVDKLELINLENII